MRVDFDSIAPNSGTVHAVLDSPNLSTPPYVLLSYQALAEPTELWDALAKLGWIVPPRPKPPASAVVQSDDGPTIAPHRVNDFVLHEGVWTADVRAKIGALTVSVLQRFGVQVHAPESYERLLFPAQVDAARAGIDAVQGPADPRPRTVLIERARSSFAGSCGYRVHGATSTLIEEGITWSERARPVAPEEEPRQALIAERALYAWRVLDGEVPLAVVESDTSLRIAVPDARQGGELLAMLRSTMGDRVGSLSLVPMKTSSATIRDGLLIIGVLERDRFGRVTEILLDRFPGILVRD